jgi:hypothetical protein
LNIGLLTGWQHPGKAPAGFQLKTITGSPVDPVFLVGFVMPAIVVDVQIEARRVDRRKCVIH